jgi:hypothetical protein
MNRRLVLPAPVAPRTVIEDLEADCDEMVFLATPEPFYAVGLYYADFSQTSDEEVIELLGRRRSFRPARRDDGDVAQRYSLMFAVKGSGRNRATVRREGRRQE